MSVKVITIRDYNKQSKQTIIHLGPCCIPLVIRTFIR